MSKPCRVGPISVQPVLELSAWESFSQHSPIIFGGKREMPGFRCSNGPRRALSLIHHAHVGSVRLELSRFVQKTPGCWDIRPSSRGWMPPARSGSDCLMSWVSCRPMPSPQRAGTPSPGQFDDEFGWPFADARRHTACRLDKAQGKFSRTQMDRPVSQGRRSEANPGEHYAALH